MTLTLAKLQQLKRQAGGTPPMGSAGGLMSAASTVVMPEASPAPVRRDVPASPPLLGIDNLRQLLRIRAPAPATARAPQDRSLPGEQIAPGLYLTQVLLPEDTLPSHFDAGFDRRADPIAAKHLLFFDTET